MRTYLVGRSPYADVVIADPSVSEQHAEVVETSDGRLFMTDCGSDQGSWRLSGEPGQRAWKPLRQGFIERDEILRLGDHECTVADLLAPLVAREYGERGSAGQEPGRGLKGRVERDPATGEVVRRRP
jgi:hypothetical protein